MGDGLQPAHSVPNLSYLSWKMRVREPSLTLQGGLVNTLRGFGAFVKGGHPELLSVPLLCSPDSRCHPHCIDGKVGVSPNVTEPASAKHMGRGLELFPLLSTWGQNFPEA